MKKSITEMSKDLVVELIKTGRIQPEDMRQMLQNVHATLTQLRAREADEQGQDDLMSSHPAEPVNWKKSIRKHSVACLVCGAIFKRLSPHHLRAHGLDPRSYRQCFGIPNDQPLAAKATTALRREMAQTIRPWEKAAKAKRTR